MTTIEVKKESKLKKFWNEYGAEIIAIGGSVFIGGMVGLVAKKIYQAGFIDGGRIGTHVMVDWLDETFPGESNARELVTRYATENPDKMVHYVRPGVWSAKG